MIDKLLHAAGEPSCASQSHEAGSSKREEDVTVVDEVMTWGEVAKTLKTVLLNSLLFNWYNLEATKAGLMLICQQRTGIRGGNLGTQKLCIFV